MMIGKFTQEGEGYDGRLHTMGCSLSVVRFSPVPAKQGNGPDFVVIGWTEDAEFELGAAWAKISKAGKPYLSVKLDGPTLAQPINCALIEDSLGTFRLMWNRSETDKAEVGEGA